MESRGLVSPDHKTKQHVSSRSFSVLACFSLPAHSRSRSCACLSPTTAVLFVAYLIIVLMTSLSYDVEHYIPCPGPIIDGLATGQCGAIIRKVIVCTGPNREKGCQRVSLSSHYLLIKGLHVVPCLLLLHVASFENDNNSPSPGSQRSGNNTPQRKPPPFSPLRHGDNNSRPPIDPALVQVGFFGAEQAGPSLSLADSTFYWVSSCSAKRERAMWQWNLLSSGHGIMLKGYVQDMLHQG